MKGGKSALWKDDKIAETLTGKAVSFIEKHKNGPFFLYFATQDAHVPRVPGAQFVGKSGMGPRDVYKRQVQSFTYLAFW